MNGTTLRHPGLDGTVQSLGGSGRHRQLLRWFAPRIEQMAKSGTERAIVDRATNLKNGVSATPCTSSLLPVVHSLVHQEIRRAFGDRCPNPQTRAVTFGVIHQPGTLSSEILIDFVRSEERRV